MVKDIEKKVNAYYVKKTIIVYGLIISMIMMIGFTLYSIIGHNSISQKFALLLYFCMFMFITWGMTFPIGTYGLQDYIGINDLGVILDYLVDFKGRDDKYLDMLIIIRNTIRGMIHKNVNQIDINSDEKKLWYWMDYYFFDNQDNSIWRIDRDNLREFVEFIKNEEQEPTNSNYVKLDEIKSRRKGIEISKFKVSVKSCFIVEYLTIFWLIVLWGVKILITRSPSKDLILNNLLLNLMYQTGADLAAIILAINSIVVRSMKRKDYSETQ